MLSGDGWGAQDELKAILSQGFDQRSGFDARTGVYSSLQRLGPEFDIPREPELDTATFVLSNFPKSSEAKLRVAMVDAAMNREVTYGELERSIYSLASGLYHALGVRKGEVVFLLSPNSLLYPVICLAVLKVGAILTTANPVNTRAEIAKQVKDSGAKLAIAAPEQLDKLVPTGLPILVTSRTTDENLVSIEELIECSEISETPQAKPHQSDTAAILYSSGTTGVSKGVVLAHSHFISIMILLRWSVKITSSENDVFLCFIPMFHIYGLVFFGLGLFGGGTKTVLMQKYDFQSMLNAIETYEVNNIAAVPPIILALVKHQSNKDEHHRIFSSLRQISSGAAPLSKEVQEGFRDKFPWVELRPGYGLTESCGAATFFVSHKQAKAHPGASGALIPHFYAKIIDPATGLPQPPGKQGELWLKSPSIMDRYLGNVEATKATLDSEGWLKTGDLCYFDEDGYLYVVDRLKELIKHNGYQVAPVELESILLGHPDILDAAVVPIEDEDAGEIPMAYIVRANGSKITEDLIIQFVASQVAPYKKVRRVGFINTIPRSAAGKTLRKDLVALTQRQAVSRL